MIAGAAAERGAILPAAPPAAALHSSRRHSGSDRSHKLRQVERWSPAPAQCTVRLCCRTRNAAGTRLVSLSSQNTEKLCSGRQSAARPPPAACSVTLSLCHTVTLTCDTRLQILVCDGDSLVVEELQRSEIVKHQ